MDLKTIALQLAEQSAQLEQEGQAAQRTAMEETAKALKLEAERRAAEKQASDEANARAEKRASDKREAEAEQLRQESEARRRIEQAADKQREDIEKADRSLRVFHAGTSPANGRGNRLHGLV